MNPAAEGNFALKNAGNKKVENMKKETEKKRKETMKRGNKPERKEVCCRVLFLSFSPFFIFAFFSSISTLAKKEQIGKWKIHNSVLIFLFSLCFFFNRLALYFLVFLNFLLAKNGHLEVVKFLLETGKVNPAVSDNAPLKMAAEQGHWKQKRKKKRNACKNGGRDTDKKESKSKSKSNMLKETATGKEKLWKKLKKRQKNKEKTSKKQKKKMNYFLFVLQLLCFFFIDDIFLLFFFSFIFSVRFLFFVRPFRNCKGTLKVPWSQGECNKKLCVENGLF